MALTTEHSGLLIVLTGPAGVGKSTISRALAERMNVKYIVSATTREKRVGDEDAKTYEYISKDEFFKRLDADAFLEYALVHDGFYGTPKHPALDYRKRLARSDHRAARKYVLQHGYCDLHLGSN